ncbi:hypothetical protein SAMN05421806_12554 [Streptomyces indicus]|uniref:Uncharacterized protein n=1 Tax=Streptomyces indicus TaxID=417292 RepID=A0A1G9IT51_9ACTN|nr:hypothetical protein SAMN05421806_12554 [Streptomyces indicus]
MARATTDSGSEVEVEENGDYTVHLEMRLPDQPTDTDD